jgi:hypothetical protein
MRWLNVLFLCLFITPAHGQVPERFYDHAGNYRGKISQEGPKMVVRDQNGDRHGYYVRQGDRIEHRDNNGNLLDYSTIK